MSSPAITPRFIDPRAQRLGAALSSVTLAAAVVLDWWPLALLVGIALAASAALGTRWFPFSRPFPLVRRALRLGPTDLEPELPPRFAQAMGAGFVGAGLLVVGLGATAGWLLVLAVVALQALLAVTGYCLGCQLYGLHWWLPEAFDRVVAVSGAGRLARARNATRD